MNVYLFEQKAGWAEDRDADIHFDVKAESIEKAKEVAAKALLKEKVMPLKEAEALVGGCKVHELKPFACQKTREVIHYQGYTLSYVPLCCKSFDIRIADLLNGFEDRDETAILVAPEDGQGREDVLVFNGNQMEHLRGKSLLDCLVWASQNPEVWQEIPDRFKEEHDTVGVWVKKNLHRFLPKTRH